MKLKIGARAGKAGYVTLDIDPRTKPDIVGDVENLKMADNSIEAVHAENVLEHVDLFKAIGELYRVCKNGAILEITMPHFSSYQCWDDLQHRHGVSYFIFDHAEDYGLRFKILQRKIRFFGGDGPPVRWSFIGYALDKVINCWPKLFERLWCYWLGGAESIYFKLEVVK